MGSVSLPHNLHGHEEQGGDEGGQVTTTYKQRSSNSDRAEREIQWQHPDVNLSTLVTKFMTQDVDSTKMSRGGLGSINNTTKYSYALTFRWLGGSVTLQLTNDVTP